MEDTVGYSEQLDLLSVGLWDLLNATETEVAQAVHADGTYNHNVLFSNIIRTVSRRHSHLIRSSLKMLTGELLVYVRTFQRQQQSVAEPRINPTGHLVSFFFKLFYIHNKPKPTVEGTNQHCDVHPRNYHIICIYIYQYLMQSVSFPCCFIHIQHFSFGFLVSGSGEKRKKKNKPQQAPPPDTIGCQMQVP